MEMTKIERATEILAPGNREHDLQKCMVDQELGINQIYNMDCVKGMKMLADESIDLVVTSPPYDNLRKYNGFEWDFEATTKELYRVIKQGGVVVWICGDATVKGSETGTSYRQALYFLKCGFNLHDTMIWQKTARIPTQDRYYNVFDFMFVFSKGKPKAMNFICDHKNVTAGQKRRKDKCINKGKNDKYEDAWIISGDTSRRENVWRIHIGRNKETQGHPAPFPEQLANDHIITWSNEGDIVLDPFMGSGTTAKMALLNKRNYIGFEISEEYCEIARKRIGEVGEGDYRGQDEN